jgi:Zn finger protein HypA/HybF involved in hydrogenase expression
MQEDLKQHKYRPYYWHKQAGLEREVKERICIKCDQKFLSVNGKRHCQKCAKNLKNIERGKNVK